jgi:ActR/RegA family two-component response regulator
VLLTAAHDIEICGEAETASEGIKLIKTYTPHIALVNLHLPDDSGIEVVKQIKQVSPSTKIVIFNPHSALQKVAQVNYIDGQLKFMILTIRYQCKTKLWIHKVELLSVFKSYFNNNI